MVYSQILTGLHAVIDVVGLPGNLLVITTIFMESGFHRMRYILLASLAVSDCLLLILGNSLNIASVAQERWLYGETMCILHIAVTRYFYLSTVLHFIAVSYERYIAIVKSPLTYDGSITASRVLELVLIWALPSLLCSAPFFLDSGFFYNPEVPFCKSAVSSHKIIFPLTLTLFVVPFIIILYLNWRVFKTANILQINIVAAAQLGSLEGSDLHKQEQFEVRRILDRKAAVDVCIIITVFLLCYLPEWITNTLFYLNKKKFLLEIIPFTRCIFYVSSLTNPIIYSIRKREFRAGVRRMLKRIGRLCGVTFILDNKNGVNSSTTQASFQRASSRAYFEAVQENRPREVILSVETLEGSKGFRMNFEKCLSPIEEGTE